MLVHFHDAPTGGHLGVNKTLERLWQQCFWYGMPRDVQVYVTTCTECNQNERLRANPRAPLQCYQAGNPVDWVHMDILGPFLESHCGNKYVLLMVDQFTRWLELQALGVPDAATVTQAFFESYTVRFGVPFVIHTDQGKNFDGIFFRVFCELLESVKTCTTPYRPSSNGQSRGTISKCWISWGAFYRVSNDAGMSTWLCWGWCFEQQSIGVPGSRLTCCSWVVRWTCQRKFCWGCHGVRSCHSHKVSIWRRCCHGWRRCIIRQDSICGKPRWPRRNIMTWRQGHRGLLKGTSCTRKTWDAKQVCYANCVLC